MEIITEYTVPPRVSVEIDSRENVVDAEWAARDLPYINEHVAHALSIVPTSDAIVGSLTGILERTVLRFHVTGMGVSTPEVERHPQG